MPESVIIALVAFLGTSIGTLGGILTANKLTNYRINQLEKKVDLHNSVITRTFVLEEQMRVCNHRVADLEEVDKKKG